MATGMLIVIEGTDGSGKATQSKLLLQRLEEKGVPTAYVDFPRYGERSAGLVENYLNGKYGLPNEVEPKVASMFYALDRYDASFGIKKSLGEGRVVVCNRYVSANMGHQGGKISDPVERNKYLNWLEDLEYNTLKIPRPDLVILLYVPYDIAQKLVDKKGDRMYITGGAKKDIHEADRDHMIAAEQAYLSIAKFKGWTIVDCTKDGEILPIGVIGDRIWSVVAGMLPGLK